MKLIWFTIAVIAAVQAREPDEELHPLFSQEDPQGEVERYEGGMREISRKDTDILTPLEEELLIPVDVESFVDDLVKEMDIVEDFGEERRVPDEIGEELLSSTDREVLRPVAPGAKGEENTERGPEISNACKRVCHQYNGGIHFDCKRFLNDPRHRYWWKRRQLTIHCFRCQRDCMLASYLDFMP